LRAEGRPSAKVSRDTKKKKIGLRIRNRAYGYVSLHIVDMPRMKARDKNAQAGLTQGYI
jgi:hypothetical protein